MTLAPNPIVLNPPSGVSKLPVFEFPEAEINKPKGQTASVKQCTASAVFSSRLLGDTDCSDLSLSAWPFFHAVAKTELARSFSRKQAELQGMMMSGMHGDLLRWKPTSLRLRRRGILSRKDASRSYLSGRFGEACTYLFMLSKGYIYWDHLPTLVDRLGGVNLKHSERVRRARIIKKRLNALLSRRKALKRSGVLEQPDFVFEKRTRERALVESKGRMVSPGKIPAFKSDLKKALGQIGVWQSLVTGTQKGFAIATYLREIGDTDDESLLAFVDPPAEDDGEPIVALANDDIRRGNYAAWLRGMGLLQSASAIAFGDSLDLPVTSLPVFQVRDQQFVVPGAQGFLRSETLRRLFGRDYANSIYFEFSPFLGLERRTMRLLEAAVRQPGGNVYNDIPTIEYGPIDGFYGSIFPDGSLFGMQSREFKFVEFQDFKL